MIFPGLVQMIARAALLVAWLGAVSGARILALMAVASHSHHLWNTKYLEALASRGHHVTYLGIDEYSNPPENVSHILIEGVYETLYRDVDFTSLGYTGPYQTTLLMRQWLQEESVFIARSEGLKQLKRLIIREKFDLVIHDSPCCEFLLGAVDVLGRPPVLGITAFGIPTSSLTVLGNPLLYSSRPYFYSGYSDAMSLLERANNYFLYLWFFAVDWIFMRKQNELSRECFGSIIRPLERIMDDINIMLVNSNHAIDYPFPKVPGLIGVGGLHIAEPKSLPQELAVFLDKAKNGVVYFSLGSNIKSSLMSREKIETLIRAFEEISPVQVLWKWESDFLPNKPRNVRVAKWFPQSEVLAHPNVRLFFTHSGLLSVQEAVYHGKPIVGMPIFLDQFVNVRKCVEKGFGEELDINSLTVNSVATTLKKVLRGSHYTEQARKASVIFRDELEKPLDRALYWTEYAIRHQGAPHLRHSVRDFSWYQNWMLDVIALIACALLVPLIIIYKVIRFMTGKRATIPRTRSSEKPIRLKQS